MGGKLTMASKSNKKNGVVNRCEIRSTHWCKNFLFAVITLAVLPGLAYGWGVSSKYESTTDCDTIKVTATGKWNDLEVECKANDIIADFNSPSANWSASEIVSHGGKTFVKLVRASTTNSDQTIVLCYTGGDGDRGGSGNIEITLNGDLVAKKSGMPAMLSASSAPIPTLSEWGMIIFSVLLLGWMARVIVNRRKRAVIA